MSIIITKYGYNKLMDEMNRLIRVERPKASAEISETRPYGVPEDNPEYIQSLKNQSLIENKIGELATILSQARVFSKEMIRENIVSFGATVTIYDIEHDCTKVYTIVSIYDSDVSKGYISNQSPLAQNMLGLTIGDSFENGDDEYDIVNIVYNDSMF